jgi:hypothetical protein
MAHQSLLKVPFSLDSTKSGEDQVQNFHTMTKVKQVCPFSDPTYDPLLERNTLLLLLLILLCSFLTGCRGSAPAGARGGGNSDASVLAKTFFLRFVLPVAVQKRKRTKEY